MRRAFLVSCLALTLLSCGSSKKGLGDKCSPDRGETGGCEEGLSCGPDAEGENVCQVPLGGECELGTDEHFCPLGANCIEFTEVNEETGEEVAVGRCYLGLHAPCDPTEDNQCEPALQCAPITGGEFQCELPVAFRGVVNDSTTGEGIEGAHVIALDETPTSVTDVAVSAADGTYRLDLPVLRDADGNPMLGVDTYTLRASADGYLTFPGGIRQAIPVNTEVAVMTPNEGWFIEGTIAEIRLVPLADPDAPRVSISGHVVVDPDARVPEESGVLVVANPSGVSGGGHSAITSRRGAYTTFNVSPGMYEVRGYKSGLQLTPAAVTAEDVDLVDVDLVVNDSPLSSISGTMQIVGSGGCDMSSIVLAVESTFDETLYRGELPATLRAPPLPELPNLAAGDTWTINDIPDGRYVVLAGFENDDCVRDPSDIGGTAIVHVELPADAGALGDTFKVTSAVPTISPGQEEPEEVSAPLTLEWGGTSGDTTAAVEVFDAYGDSVFTASPAATNDTVESIEYTGPLEAGMYYQFRVTTLSNNGTPLQQTEDLRGVFFVR